MEEFDISAEATMALLAGRDNLQLEIIEGSSASVIEEKVNDFLKLDVIPEKIQVMETTTNSVRIFIWYRRKI